MRELQASAVIVCTLFLFNGRITAQSFVFDTPDAAIPGIPADGLDGLIWSSPSIAPVNDLVAVAAYIASNDPQASFVSTVVDYPNGNVGSIVSTSTFNVGLGVDAASISNPVIAATAVSALFHGHEGDGSSACRHAAAHNSRASGDRFDAGGDVRGELKTQAVSSNPDSDLSSGRLFPSEVGLLKPNDRQNRHG